MKIKSLFSDVKLIEPIYHNDDRGFFSEIYNKNIFYENGVNEKFIQDNLSFSLDINTIRGIHFQNKPYQQTKLLKVLKGSIFDVFIDLRKDSETYEKYNYINLKEKDGWLYIPKGYAHGFCTTSSNTTVIYKVDNYYNPEADTGIIWNDSFFDIPWPIENNNYSISDKDSKLPTWKELKEKGAKGGHGG